VCYVGVFQVYLFFFFSNTIIMQTEAELLAEKRCVAHLIGEVDILIL